MPVLPSPTPPPQTDPAFIQRPLGRLADPPDPRDFPFDSLRSAIWARPRRRSFRVWMPPRKPLNQGAFSSCTEHALTHRLLGFPRPQEGLAIPWKQHDLYRYAQEYDEWPGSEASPPVYYGTSLRAVLEAARVRYDVVQSYWRLYSLEDVLDYILVEDHLGGGSVLLGVNWSEGMWQTDAAGFIHYDASRVRGGHAVLLYGANENSNTAFVQNSWGASFGYGHSRCRIHIRGEDGLDALIRDEADCWAVVERGSAVAGLAAEVVRDIRGAVFPE